MGEMGEWETGRKSVFKGLTGAWGFLWSFAFLDWRMASQLDRQNFFVGACRVSRSIA